MFRIRKHVLTHVIIRIYTIVYGEVIFQYEERVLCKAWSPCTNPRNNGPATGENNGRKEALTAKMTSYPAANKDNISLQ